MMEMKICMMQRQAHRLVLTHEQRILLKQLLLQRQELIHPEFPNATKGFEGMIAADEFLKEKEYTGILIGGLSESVWNYKRTKDQLAEHKDVDVLVLDENCTIEPFEKGIDWWTYQRGLLEIYRPGGEIKGSKKWLENCNGVRLKFRVNERCKPGLLESGLYIPNPDWVARMRQTELTAGVDYERLEYDISDVAEVIYNKVLRKMKTRVPEYVAGKFKSYILDDFYEHEVRKVETLELEEVDLREQAAINRFKEKVMDTNFN